MIMEEEAGLLMAWWNVWGGAVGGVGCEAGGGGGGTHGMVEWLGRSCGQGIAGCWKRRRGYERTLGQDGVGRREGTGLQRRAGAV